MTREPRALYRARVRVIVVLVTAGAILGLALRRDKTREAVAFLRLEPECFHLNVVITPPTGDGWNPAFELRYITLNHEANRAVRLFRSAWPSGRPQELTAELTDAEVDRVIRQLAKVDFFEDASEDWPLASGAGCWIHVSGTGSREPYWRSSLRWASNRVLGYSVLPPHVGRIPTFSATYAWDPPRLARRLRRLRAGLDGSAAAAIDAMIRQIPSVPR